MTRTPSLPEPPPTVEEYAADGSLIQRTDSRDLEPTRAWMIEQTKHMAYRLLRETDHERHKALDTETPVPLAIRTERQTIRATITAIRLDLNAAATLDDLDAANWSGRCHALMMQYRPELGG